MMKINKRSDLNLVKTQVKALLDRSQSFHSLPTDKRRQIANDTIKIANYLAAQERGGAEETVASVDFPSFVSDLVNGVFEAIVNASIKQMDAYAKLVAGVAKSLDEFASSSLSDKEAQKHLFDRLPSFFKSRDKAKRLRVRLASRRRRVLATMMLMGINRIVVTRGTISATVK